LNRPVIFTQHLPEPGVGGRGRGRHQFFPSQIFFMGLRVLLFQGWVDEIEAFAFMCLCQPSSTLRTSGLRILWLMDQWTCPASPHSHLVPHAAAPYEDSRDGEAGVVPRGVCCL